jgi:A/G-specific adenine glycosylase
VRRRLLSWFAEAARALPWRRDRDPYRIWVSEIMLQQTTVAAVVPYFERFLQAFPTLPALAAASEQQVLRLWEGLGYYRRARDLHQAARRVAAEHDGRVPNDPYLFGGLPGVGRYVLGAVLSQAFERRLPILEANTVRLLSRFFGRPGDAQSSASRRWLWAASEQLLPTRDVGEFNQALMELGALVCTPVSPRCGECPLARRCRARQLGLQDRIPPRSLPTPVVHVQEAAIVARRAGKVLLVQRPPTGRWASMWEFPHGPLEPGETHEAAAGRLLAGLTGIRAVVGPELLSLRHAVTNHHITLVCFEARYRGGRFSAASYVQGRWVDPKKLSTFPVSAPQRRLARALVEEGQKRLF